MQGNIGQLGKVSIHAPHEGERPLSFVPCGLQPHGFNPRSPRGGATKHGVTIQDVARSFNPRSPRGGATMFGGYAAIVENVSIHAPHEGERLVTQLIKGVGFIVSIHAPHEGERPGTGNLNHHDRVFQSTLPTRGSDMICGLQQPQVWVSIHAPHEGERLVESLMALGQSKFQSTLPTRGSDELIMSDAIKDYSFNPRSPRGGATDTKKVGGDRPMSFNPRSPRGGATFFDVL